MGSIRWFGWWHSCVGVVIVVVRGLHVVEREEKEGEDEEGGGGLVNWLFFRSF